MRLNRKTQSISVESIRGVYPKKALSRGEIDVSTKWIIDVSYKVAFSMYVAFAVHVANVTDLP
jgi:hypothetical protein